MPIHPAVVADSSGLQIVEPVTLEDWRAIGETLATVSSASAWWIGDWLVYGQDAYPDRYKRAIDRTMLDYQTLRNYSWVARKFAPSRRRKSLSFQHHVEVAGLRPEEQDHWLELSEKFKWSKNALRKQIKNSSERAAGECADSSFNVQLELNQNRVQSWESAAQRSNRSLQSWIVSTLDAAADNG
ncbi:MAG: LmbU family transcriptional regulator [Saccharopolyspora sp.]|uniref:LmbU family transcriptional regulator n=1 Tax=unclassified Saccharopolyspora TaxID=2646250 RepID=UPI0025D81424|nr:LmbU family transcriptional regulator [Saccharopolyspora sp.]MBQ6641595.1 LmbU family transcriptional regulator [Saccharopolyspora sp.]